MSFRVRFFHLALFLCAFFVCYFLVGKLPRYASFNGAIALDRAIPFIPYFVLFYAMGFFYALALFFLIDGEAQLRAATNGMILIALIASFFFLALPMEIERDAETGDGVIGTLVRALRSIDTTFNTFPSLHVAFTFYAWLVFFAVNRRFALWTAPLAALIIVSVLFVKQHVFVDLLGGAALAAGVFRLWRARPALLASPLGRKRGVR